MTKRFFRLLVFAWKMRKHQASCAEFLKSAAEAYHGVEYVIISGKFVTNKGYTIPDTKRCMTKSEYLFLLSKGHI